MVKVRALNPYKTRRPKIAAIIFGILAALVLAAAVFTAFNTYTFLKGAHSVSAKVVAMRVDQSGGASVFLPMFEVPMPDGQVLQISAWQQSPEYGFQKGQMVDVLLNPTDPGSVRIDNWQDTWKPVMTLLFVAGFLLAISVMAAILHARWMREQPDYANRDDYFPKEDEEEVLYFNTSGRVYSLRKPKVIAIALGIPGVLFLGAGIYSVANGVEFEQEDQGIAFFVGAAVLLSLALYAWRTHVKWSRAKARAEARSEARDRG